MYVFIPNFYQISAGAHDEITLKETPLAYQRIKLLPRVLRDVSNINMKQEIFGEMIDFPICISPSGKKNEFSFKCISNAKNGTS